MLDAKGRIKMKIQIKSVSGKILFTCNAKSLRDAVVTAVKAKVNLSGVSLFGKNLPRISMFSADLSGVDLSSAKLSYADLFGVNLFNANLSNADLSCANLSYADLSNANLSGANLSWADLSYATLSDVNLSYANLTHAYLSGADLSGADLSDAKLSDADLSDAILRGAKNIPALAVAQTSIVPETGAFEAWKKCTHGVLVRLRIPAHAARSNATGRKCRASEAKVLEIIGADEARSIYDDDFVYRVGKTIKADKWNPDRWTECGDGIHFFLTRAEAENY
jgi:hypothetical protein